MTEVVATVADLRERRAALPGPVGVVPTMGFLHAGHASLIRRARSECARVILTLFVNPAQFGPSEDLARYPRDFAADLSLSRAEGVDLLFHPPVEEVYPPGFDTSVSVGGVSERWEGEHRPGHFAGVATVVAKLLIATRADIAYLGEKDFQQLQVVRRLARDLDLPTAIVGCATIRDPDGLALSSRNAYLDAPARQRAVGISRGLRRAAALFREGARDPDTLRTAVLGEIAECCLIPDYVAVVDPADLTPTATLTMSTRVLVAARVDRVRLIDNCALGDPPP
ncbi:MAG: pantoate--beta-alanine ligase [Chloroflexi bacterium]|nr:pantoate--beta-alanine ligase [Chloroflexota bacterium]